MQTKTYFANSVPSALDVARQELGAEALLLSSRPSPDEMRQYGPLEVTFAWDPRRTGNSAAAEYAKFELTSGVSPGGVGDAPAPRGRELDDIRQQLSALRIALGRPASADGEPHEDPMAIMLARTLRDAGLSRDLGWEVARAIYPVGADSVADIDENAAVERELARRIPIAPTAEMKTGESRTLALIGPSGRGKTTTLVKLAVRLGLARRVPVRIYSAGVHAVGGREQIARYAAILGVPQQAFELLDSLNLALAGEAWKGLILIDTPGISPAEQEEMRVFQGFFASRPEVEKHLVLRAEAHSEDTLRTVKRFAGLQPSRLLFTGFDEVSGLSGMAETLMRAGIPGAFVGTGPRIPEDLEELEASAIARRLRVQMEARPVTKPLVRTARAGG